MKNITTKHLFFDGYSIEQKELENVGKVTVFLENVNKLFFNSKGKIVLIPYFDGKVKIDGGISGVVLGNNKHFTIHTFCYKNTVFIDYFGAEASSEKEDMKEIILKEFTTKDYDLCDTASIVKGKFGKHIIIKHSDIITFEETKELVKRILKDIEMTPINEPIINYVDENNYDILQPIAESHISFHRVGDEIIIDAFSCKYFDEQKLLKILNHTSNNFIQVDRGKKYK